jgi:hypothetical protein
MKSNRREYLLRKQEAREYNMMIHGTARSQLFFPPSLIFRVSNAGDTIASSLKSVKYTLSVSSNMVMTLIAMFGLGYYGASKQGWSKHQVSVD